MPRIPGRGVTWSRKRDPVSCPEVTADCKIHGSDVPHRRYTLGSGCVITQCVECQRKHGRENSRKNYADKKAGRLPAGHPLTDPEPIKARNPICPECYLETANNGTCGC